MVQLYVSHLRRVLGNDGVRIVTRDRGYELQLTEGVVDTLLAERLLDERRPRDALALWRGEPLADLSGEPFARDEIRRLEELRLRATEMAIDADLEAGRHSEVIGELDALVAEQPLREHLHGQRMLALYRCGRQSEALEAYRDARSGLVEEVGVEPGAGLQRLHDAILAHDPALDLPTTDEPEPTTEPRPPPQRRSRALLVGAAVLLLAGITAFGLIRVLGPEGLPGIDENYVGLIDPDTGRITKEIAVGKGPAAATDGGGSVWIANAADGTVSRIDLESGEAVTIPVGGAPAAVTFGAGSLWVADSDSRDVVQVDPGANKVVARYPVGNMPRSLAFADGVVWVASGVDGRIRGLDLASRSRDEVDPCGREPVRDRGRRRRAVGGERGVGDGDARSTRGPKPSCPRSRVGNGPSALAFGEGAVWVVNRHDGTLSRIDPATNAVSWSVGVGTDPTAVAVGEGAVWVAGGEEGTVARVDPDGPSKAKRFETGSRPAAIAVAGGSVWAAADAPQTAHRGGTLRVSLPYAPGAGIVLDPLHWLSYTTSITAQLNSLAYDGLVAYRRVEGPAGHTLVGALATTAPEPSDDGKTYVFTLRPGLRYSDGQPGPADRLQGLDGALPGRHPQSAGHRGAPAVLRQHRRRSAVHAAACRLRPVARDRDQRTGAHDHHPPDPPGRGSPAQAHDALRRRRPGRQSCSRNEGRDATGDRALSRRRLGLPARWDLRAQPLLPVDPARSRGEGFADRIEVRVHTKTIERQIAAVQRGDADLAVLADPFNTLVSEGRLRALVARSPGLVQSAPAATTDWAFLDTQQRPFDDLGVRRALNFAIDRAKVVELSGGPEVGEPTCQVVPAGFQGNSPYCPYTASPARGADGPLPTWSGRARLVAASGRAGEHVTVWVPDFREAVGRYFAKVLDELGFRASVRVLGFNDPSPRRPQLGFTGWLADYLGASTFITTRSRVPPGSVYNLSRICDAGLQRLIDRATVSPPADAAGEWAAADHRVTDLAPVVPLTRRRWRCSSPSAWATSRRTGSGSRCSTRCGCAE